MAAAFGDERIGHGLERLEFADQSVTTAVGAATAAVTPYRVLDDAQRELEFQRFDRRVEGVRHRDVDGAGAVGVIACTLASAERLVMGERLGPDGEVVHRPLAECAPERRQDEIRDARRRLDVSRGHGGGARRVQQRALGDDDGQRPLGAGARWDVRVGEDTQAEQAGRHGDGQRAVEIAVVLRRRAGEVEHQLVAGNGRRQAQLDVTVAALEDVAGVTRSVRQLLAGRHVSVAPRSRGPPRSLR